MSSWLGLLLSPGSSLGGARPKASVVDEKAGLWIAKFPSRSDEFNTGLWEYLTYGLASKCGINTVDFKTEKYSASGNTFLLRRFDRTIPFNGTLKRKHFASAMTLLSRNDGDDSSTGVSYLDILELILEQSESPEVDALELWKRPEAECFLKRQFPRPRSRNRSGAFVSVEQE